MCRCKRKCHILSHIILFFFVTNLLTMAFLIFCNYLLYNNSTFSVVSLIFFFFETFNLNASKANTELTKLSQRVIHPRYPFCPTKRFASAAHPRKTTAQKESITFPVFAKTIGASEAPLSITQRSDKIQKKVDKSVCHDIFLRICQTHTVGL